MQKARVFATVTGPGLIFDIKIVKRLLASKKLNVPARKNLAY